MAAEDTHPLEARAGKAEEPGVRKPVLARRSALDRLGPAGRQGDPTYRQGWTDSKTPSPPERLGRKLQGFLLSFSSPQQVFPTLLTRH